MQQSTQYGTKHKSRRRGRGGGERDAEDPEDRSGSDGSRDAGTKTGDAQVVKLSCVYALRK